MRPSRVLPRLFVTAVLATAVTLHVDAKVPPAQTQPPGDRLLDSAGVVAAAKRLAANPRVTMTTIGTSAGGRPIVMLAITAPGQPSEEWQRRARRLAGPDVRYTTLTQATRDVPPVDELLKTTRLPVLLAGASWGHEASQVEGLLAAAEQLATDTSPETAQLLDRVVVLLIPLMNPDGRDRAVEEWRRTPLSNGDAAVANENGFMLNRDFVHQTQPESQAVGRVVREWRPVVGIDLHEDVNRLGLAVPEVTFVPPYVPGFDVEEHPATRKAIIRVGDAIARRWRDAGHTVVHDPEGDRKWVPLPPRGSGDINPVAGSSGRLEFLFNIHGITGLITESARTPGTQTWEARVDQKKLTVLATAGVVAADPAFFARTVFERRTEAAKATDTHPFVAIPHDQPAGSDRAELLRLLRQHDVLVYRAGTEPYDVVPLEQPERAFIEHALLATRSKLNDLGAALGVTITPSSALAGPVRTRLSAAPLQLAEPAAMAWPRAGTTRAIAVYEGQGMDRSASGEIAFVLRMAGLSPRAIDEDDVRLDRLEGIDTIVFGDGAAREIVDGWSLDAATRKAPWEPAVEPRGISSDGVAALARFVRAGGRLVTIGRSTGLLTPQLLRVSLPSTRPGIGEVKMQVTADGRALFNGTRYGDEARGFLSAPPGGRDGGYLFKPALAADVVAWYAGVDERPEEQSFAQSAAIGPTSRTAAIMTATVGEGRVTAFAFSPVFRAQWRATFPLLFGAL